MKSPIHWIGGKGRMAEKILPYFPQHTNYVEVFGGGGSLLFAKNPSTGQEVYNDIDPGLTNFYRTIQKPDAFQVFYRQLILTPYSREMFAYCRDTWMTTKDTTERAYRWYVTARTSFGGNFGQSWGSITAHSSGGVASTSGGWMSVLSRFPKIHRRMINVLVENQDFRVILDKYDSPETLFYCDPPYVLESRKGGCYAFEMQDKDHKELIQLLLSRKAKVVLSGYPTPMYKPLETAGWNVANWDVACNVVGRVRSYGMKGTGATEKFGQRRIECVWIKP